MLAIKSFVKVTFRTCLHESSKYLSRNGGALMAGIRQVQVQSESAGTSIDKIYYHAVPFHKCCASKTNLSLEPVLHQNNFLFNASSGTLSMV